MKKITAFDWINNNIKSEDLFEHRSNLGLNKRVQKKYQDIDAIENISEYVDLGLPSRTLWCKHNYGVEKEYEFGELYTFDDAQKLDIKLPTKDDFIELDKYCDHEWTEMNGVNGMLFTSKSNNKSVFFPAAGYYYSGILQPGILQHTIQNRGSHGAFWTSSLYSSTKSYNMYFYNSEVCPKDLDSRFYSFSVRAVQ